MNERVDGDVSVEYPVSDIDLSFTTWHDEISAMDDLLAPNGFVREERDWSWTAQFDVVADGRMFRGGWGKCIHWEDDVTHCVNEDGGGNFQIERKVGETEIRVHLILRLSSMDIESNLEEGTNYRPAILVQHPENGNMAHMVLPNGNEGRITFVLPRY